MAKFPTIEEIVQRVKERVYEEILIDGEPLGKLIDSGDLVHIVRCKDCKHWNDYYRECQSPNWNTGTNDYFVTPAGFYCGWAERKEE